MNLHCYLGTDVHVDVQEAVHRFDHTAAEAVLDRHQPQVAVSTSYLVEHGADIR